MLELGIYEQIVNEKLKKELQELDKEKCEVSLESLDVDDARKILTIYISSVISQGLRYIREGFLSTQDSEALLAQIQFCNDIVDELCKRTGNAFADEKISEQGEVLTSLYNKINSAKSITKVPVIRPATSILENTLFTGSKNEPSMMSELKKEIASSDAVDLLVSFIKWSAIRPLLKDLEDFTSRDNARLRIITTTYTKATDYRAIEALAKLPNTEIKINYETNHARMHAKSYLFKRNTGFSTAYIGSSNLSSAALTDGLEWNMKVTEKESFDIVKKFDVSFESYWNDPSFETFDLNNEECCNKLREELTPDVGEYKLDRRLHATIRPYAYQQKILDRLTTEREVYGRCKNLIHAATGVGKTIIAAFDYKRFKETHPRARLLFVAHRKEILQQSMETFQEVVNDFNFGELYVDGHKPKDIDHLFVSIQSFNSAEFTKFTTSDYYDFIVVDEFHHAAANSYQDLLNFYEPTILLGLTATPNRMDGKDVLKYFDGHIASSMLLGEAIDRNLLCPFQYYGISDTVDYSKLNWTRGRYDVNQMEGLYTGDMKRCALILNSTQKYVKDIHSVKALGFCVSVAHAEYMAKYFNEKGISSIALSGKSPDEIRSEAKEALQTGKVNFIFVVDLYNEGVDIPEVDTVLFLRPTESATIFLQQLGRGLRKHKDKECLTVLDFIGQANKKYSYAAKFEAIVGKGRKSLKKQFEEGFANLPRGCYIELEKYAKDYVLENLNQTDNNKNVLTEKGRTFTEDTGLELTLENFLEEYNLSLYEFYKNDGSRSLYRLKKWAGLITDAEDVEDKTYSVLTSLFHIDSVRLLDYWIAYLEKGKNPENEEERIMKNMLYYSFYKKHPAKMGFQSIDAGIQAVVAKEFVKDEVIQILKYNRSHVDTVPLGNEYDFVCPLDMHCRYNTNQVMAAFGLFDETTSPEFREGVKYFEGKKTDVFFINLNKSEKDFSPSTMYEDYAISATRFHWQSQSQDRQESSKIQRYIHHQETKNNVSLFVREYKKNGSYTAPYTFLGNSDYESHEGEKPVSFVWKMHRPIPASMMQKANKSIIL